MIKSFANLFLMKNNLKKRRVTLPSNSPIRDKTSANAIWNDYIESGFRKKPPSTSVMKKKINLSRGMYPTLSLSNIT